MTPVVDDEDRYAQSLIVPVTTRYPKECDETFMLYGMDPRK